jgi:hypothetical protein
MSRAFHIVCGDLFDKLRDIDASRATFSTGRVVAEQAAVRFHQRRFFGFERRMDITEIFGVLLLG